ncbi:hypothetical protein ACSBR2_004259 [Camellia fascicularis]
MDISSSTHKPNTQGGLGRVCLHRRDLLLWQLLLNLLAQKTRLDARTHLLELVDFARRGFALRFRLLDLRATDSEAE